MNGLHNSSTFARRVENGVELNRVIRGTAEPYAFA